MATFRAFRQNTQGRDGAPFEFIHGVKNCRPGRVARYEYCSPGPPFLIPPRNPCRDNWLRRYGRRSGPREKIPSPQSSINKMESVMDDQAEIFQIRQKLDRPIFLTNFLAVRLLGSLKCYSSSTEEIFLNHVCSTIAWREKMRNDVLKRVGWSQ